MRNHGKLKVIVVAGDKGRSHPVFGTNKTLLDVEGVPVVARVVSALGEAKSVAEIFVVGPKQKLEEVLSPEYVQSRVGKPVHIFEQGNTLYENVWNTFLILIFLFLAVTIYFLQEMLLFIYLIFMRKKQ